MTFRFRVWVRVWVRVRVRVRARFVTIYGVILYCPQSLA